MTKKSRDRRKAHRKEHMEKWGYLYKRLRRVIPFHQSNAKQIIKTRSTGL